MKKIIESLILQSEEVQLEPRLDPRRFFFLRPSAFPACGFKKLMTAPEVLEGEPETLGSSYFTSVGSTVHDLYQRFVGHTGKMVGDWTCRKCKKEWSFCTLPTCDCGGEVQYRELEVNYRSIVGHVDGLVKVRVRSKVTGKSKWVYIVIDYKTASYHAMLQDKDKKRERAFPYSYNVHQISKYIPLLERKYGIKIAGWALIYLSRNAPLGSRNFSVVYKSVDVDKKAAMQAELDRWVETHKKTLKAKTLDDFREVEGEKLCKSAKDYKERWAGFGDCPCMPYCFDEKRREAKIQTRLDTGIYPLIRMATPELKKELKEKDGEKWQQ